MDNPSVSEANKVLRVLKGTPLKYTVRLHFPDGKMVEFQNDKRPKIKFSDENRCLWLYGGGYEDEPIMKWIDGSILLVEENPKP